ncbi:MAG: hypothetical protein H8E66_16830 [Planctomycetes bacterium]|nr:hypothetical protein [Planctomycetota bacterium]
MAIANLRNRLPNIGTLLALILLMMAFISMNILPGENGIGVVNHGVLTQYEWQWFGWPATYLTQDTSRTLYAFESSKSTEETQFKLSALAVNIVVACSVCGLIWCAGSFIRKRRFGLRTLFFVMLCVAALSAAFAHAESSSLKRTAPWQRQSE